MKNDPWPLSDTPFNYGTRAVVVAEAGDTSDLFIVFLHSVSALSRLSSWYSSEV